MTRISDFWTGANKLFWKLAQTLQTFSHFLSDFSHVPVIL